MSPEEFMAAQAQQAPAGSAAPPPPPPPPMSPQQFLSAADPAWQPNAPNHPESSLETSAPIWTQMRASLAPDVQSQIRRFAAARFPDMPVGLAAQRYGVIDGNIVYTDEHGQVHRETPSLSGSPSWWDWFQRVGLRAGAGTGPLLPQIAGGGAGATTAPVLPWLSVPIAGTVATSVDLIRQSIDRALAGESVTNVDPANAALHGILASGGQAVPAVAGAVFNRNPLRVGGQDLSTLRDPANLAGYRANEDLARRFGITVTPAENTGAVSLLNRQRQLSRFDESATPMGQFYEMRNTEQVPGAFERFAPTISPTPNAAEGARQFVTGAERTVQGAVDARRAAARPIYQEVMTPEAVVPAERWTQLQSNPLVASQLQAIRSDPIYAAYREMPDNSLPVLDLVKRRMDDMASAASRAGRNNEARLISGARDDLVGTLDELFPRYPAAREAFAGASPEVTAMQEGPVGRAAAERFDRFQRAPAEIFSRANADPLTITQARTAFERAGQMDSWNAGLRSFLEDKFSAAMTQENTARGFYNAVYADPRQRAILNAAMTPEQQTAFRDFMRVMEMVRRQPVTGSPTATDAGARAAFAGPIARGTAQVANAAGPWNIPARVRDFALDLSAGRNAGAIADIITSPGAVERLSQLRMLPPNGARAIGIVSNLLDNYAVSGMGLRTPADQPIPAQSGRRQ